MKITIHTTPEFRMEALTEALQFLADHSESNYVVAQDGITWGDPGIEARTILVGRDGWHIIEDDCPVTRAWFNPVPHDDEPIELEPSAVQSLIHSLKNK